MKKTEDKIVCDIATLLDMTQSSIKLVIYSLDDEHVLRLFEEGIEHIRHKDKNK